MSASRVGLGLFGAAAMAMLLLLILPIIGLLSSSSPASILAGLRHPHFGAALWLSLQTTAVSLCCLIALGTPLAWWLARSQSRWTRVVMVFVDLPMVIPPAVIGIALLMTFGRNGWLGAFLVRWGVQIPFTPLAVVLAQSIVAAPLFLQSAVSAFRRIDDDLLLVARTLGQSPMGAWWRVAVPMALPGLISGAALAWGRALGEFGGTLLFAGNLPGKTQTLPLAIYTALESDIRLALAISLLLAGCGVLLLGILRWFSTEEVPGH